MPGIVGIIGQSPAHESRRVVNYMLNSMRHETFYDSGTHAAPEMGIYAGWIAPKGSFAATQVFFNNQKDIALIFSGECFLDAKTQANLRQRGCRAERNKGDWLVHLYEQEDSRFFEKLNGLFSGLLVDNRKGKAFLFNDRYGVERIYWHEKDGALYFASEAKALLRVLPELRAFDQEGIAQFLTFGCTLGQRTLFRGVQLLPGASLWSFENGKCQKKRYFFPETWESQSILPAESFGAEFQETFKRILPPYFESESKVGISLTAGLDSRMIMACRSSGEEKPICYTFSGQSRDTLDARLARRVAGVCNLEHEILRLGGDFFSNFASHVDRTVYITDGCAGPLGAHELYLNSQARQLAPVRVTGVFGGEILRGVSMFKPFRLSPRLLHPGLNHTVNCVARRWTRNGQHPLTFTAFCEIPEKRFGIPAVSRSQLTFRTPFLDNEVVALAYRAPESVRALPRTVWSIIQENSQLLSNIPTDMGLAARGLTAAPRRFVSKAVCKLDYLYAEGLPHWLSPIDRLFERLGSTAGLFGWHKFLHYRRWFRRELAGYIADALNDVQSRGSPFWKSDFLETLALEHINGRRNYLREIDAVLTLEAVDRLLLHDVSREPEQSVSEVSYEVLPVSI